MTTRQIIMLDANNGTLQIPVEALVLEGGVLAAYPSVTFADLWTVGVVESRTELMPARVLLTSEEAAIAVAGRMSDAILAGLDLLDRGDYGACLMAETLLPIWTERPEWFNRPPTCWDCWERDCCTHPERTLRVRPEAIL